MARKQWGNLSPGYRARLERRGISASDYAAGVSLADARGHGATPERPGAGKDRPEFGSYYQARREVTQLKRELFGGVGSGSIKEMGGKSTATLKKALQYLKEMQDSGMSRDAMIELYPELELAEWDWLFHYH